MTNEFKKTLTTNTLIPTYGDDVSILQKELYMYGYLDKSSITGYYTQATASAIKKYQSDNSLNVTGEVDKNTWDMLFDNRDNSYVKQIKEQQSAFKNNISNLNNNLPSSYRSAVVYNTKKLSPNNEPSIYNLNMKLQYSGSPKDTPFFAPDNSHILRKANQTIKIMYGDEVSKTKTITNVFLRNKSQIIDANGTPIFDTYEFIGSDIVEDDNVYLSPTPTGSTTEVTVVNKIYSGGR